MGFLGALGSFAKKKVDNTIKKATGDRHWTNSGPIPIAPHEMSPLPSAAPMAATPSYTPTPNDPDSI